LGPYGVLSALGAACVSGGHFVPALRKDRPEAETLVGALASLHGHGHAVDWQAFFAPLGARRVTLPSYPFQRQRHWLDASAPRRARTVAASASHPLLGDR